MVEKLIDFSNFLKNNQELSTVSNHGYCRIWTKKATDFAHTFFETSEWEIMAREVLVDKGYYHTFLRVRSLDDELVSFFYDGTGTYKFPPYFGSEKDSPQYLKNNCRDQFSNSF